MTAAELSTILLGAAGDALPYLAAGVGAGAVLLAINLGIRRAKAFFIVLAGMNEDSPGGNWGSAWSHSARY